MSLSCGNVLVVGPSISGNRDERPLANSCRQEDDIVLLMHGTLNAWLRSMALTLHKVVTYR